MKIWAFLLFVLCSLTLSAKEGATECGLELYLHQPEAHLTYIETKKGGVIREGPLRIQAQTLRYYFRNGDENKKTLIAEGQLAFDNGHYLILADRLIYHLDTKEGTASQVRMSVGDWFVGGKRLELASDGTMTLYDAFLTPSESIHFSYALRSKKVTITHGTLISAENVRFEMQKVPLLYLPYLKANLKKSNDSPISYSLNWVSGQGPQLTFRYRIYSSKTSSIFARADLRSSRGFGGAIETDTHTDKIQFITKNYLAHDTFYRDDNPNAKITRYRLLGRLKAAKIHDPYFLEFNYDRLNDKNLPDEFVGGDFEYHTAQNTFLRFRASQKRGVFGVDVTPRINSFQGFKQELPSLFYHFYPLAIGPVQWTQTFKGQFLDYVSAKEIKTSLHDFHSLRFNTNTQLSSPFRIGPMHLTPGAGIEVVHYTRSNGGGGLTQTLFNYQIASELPFFRQYPCLLHQITPYIAYHGVSKPSAPPGKPLIFSIEDGVNRLNQIDAGVKQHWHVNDSPNRHAHLQIYLQSFLGPTPFSSSTPFFRAELETLFEIIRVRFSGRWNQERETIDYCLTEMGWTLSPRLALSILYAYRSPFYYRRVDQDDYFLDVTQPLSSILETPLSDKRHLLRTKLQFPLSPLWKIQMQTMHSWDRAEEPSFTEIKIDALTYLTTKWLGRASYAYTVRGHLFNVAIELAY